MSSKAKRKNRQQKLGDIPSKATTPIGSHEPNTRETVYVKALPLTSTDDVDLIKREVRLGNILIINLIPLARKNMKHIKPIVNELRKFSESIGGGLARIGEERIIITPSSVKIWRKKADTNHD